MAMKHEIKLYYNGDLIQGKWAESLAYRVSETMKVGDECTLYPFNFMGDEDKAHATNVPAKEYHCKPLRLARIERSFIDGVNSITRTSFSYFLED